jgi:catechol-2,3-dioxygenase
VSVRHLNLDVTDVERSRAFYARWFGFDHGEPEWLGDALFVRDAAGFDLALRPVERPPDPSAFHFGIHLDDADAVRALATRLRDDDVAIVEWHDELGFTSLKCRDPDGYTIEVYAG